MTENIETIVREVNIITFKLEKLREAMQNLSNDDRRQLAIFTYTHNRTDNVAQRLDRMRASLQLTCRSFEEGRRR